MAIYVRRALVLDTIINWAIKHGFPDGTAELDSLIRTLRGVDIIVDPDMEKDGGYHDD